MRQLELITTDELIEELKSRFDGLVLMAIQKEPNKGYDEEFHNWSGGQALCLGLCMLLKRKILSETIKE